ncbi:trypsin-like peptidase domain-containing protein [Gracilibacillus caseinilyticus]|uniref:Serine protease n=1 Tax=Gracilibacillus caseinilyticus TaxID=2932256 RepID=A0ABY4EUN1_9BACI|nr:trypsin-like peptidase domain-containing protein [Gracilibacillus caseinilyticus]UOQ47776.1 trypsin-like peptidase domain-containing protein [Gracilibacillus caseinilyticus]
MKTKLISVFFVLFFLCLFSPITSMAVESPNESDTTKIEISDSFDVTKVEEDLVPILEDKLEKHKEKLPKINNYSSNKVKQIINNYSEFDSLSSQGKVLEGPNEPIVKKSNEVINLNLSPLATDNRVKITNTTTNPHNAMAHVVYSSPNGDWYTCSGTFLDEDTVITAAHCVYNTYTNQFNQFWYVYPGQNGSANPYGGWASASAYVTLGWVDAAPTEPGIVYFTDVQHDFAVIKLDTTHSHNLSVSSNSSFGDSITSYGYPGDKATSSGYYLYKSTGSILDIEYDALVHSTYVTGGMSGGPILKNNNVISVNSTASWGPQLTSTHIDLINQWKNN